MRHELMDDGGPVLEIIGHKARPVVLPAEAPCPLIAFGGRLMKARVDANRRLRVEVKRLGLSPCVLIDQELGRRCLRCDQGPEQCRCTETELEQAARAEGRLP